MLIEEDKGRDLRKTLRIIKGLLSLITFVPKISKEQIIEKSAILYKTLVLKGELKDHEKKLNKEEFIQNQVSNKKIKVHNAEMNNLLKLNYRKIDMKIVYCKTL
jgi:hypothetical protein